MAYTPSVLEQVQLAMGGRAQAHPYFNNVQVTVLRPRDAAQAVMIQGNLDKTLSGVAATGGNAGAAILINLPSGNVPNPEAPGPVFQLIYSARVMENPLINMGANGTLKSAEDLMLALINLFHGWFVQWLGGTMTADKQPFDPVPSFLEKGMIVYDVRFLVKLGIQGRKKTPLPGITGTSGAGVLITVPPGAQAWYTLDGSYPWSGNPDAVLYDPSLQSQDGSDLLSQEGGAMLPQVDPTISVASGTLVSAVAYAPNQTASDLACLIVP